MSARYSKFVISRIIHAPRALVFRAWTDPQQLTQWWGPRGFSNPVCELDVRRGGLYRIVMRGVDGIDYPIKGVYREVEEPSLLVMTLDCSEHPKAWHDLVNPTRAPGDDNPAGEMLQTVTFEDMGGKTRLTIRLRIKSAAILAAMRKMGMNEGWSESLDRLEQLMAQSNHAIDVAEREIVFTRMLAAPREQVFQAYSEQQHVAQWWGPIGFTTTIREMEVRPGGVWRFVMHGADGTDYPNRVVYIEVLKPERLVYFHSGDAEDDPAQFHVTLTLAEQDGKTGLTLRMQFASAEEREHVIQQFGAIEGGNQTLDRLAAYLPQMT